MLPQQAGRKRKLIESKIAGMSKPTRSKKYMQEIFPQDHKLNNWEFFNSICNLKFCLGVNQRKCSGFFSLSLPSKTRPSIGATMLEILETFFNQVEPKGFDMWLNQKAILPRLPEP